jgi:hypothetical protein
MVSICLPTRLDDELTYSAWTGLPDQIFWPDEAVVSSMCMMGGADAGWLADVASTIDANNVAVSMTANFFSFSRTDKSFLRRHTLLSYVVKDK